MNAEIHFIPKMIPFIPKSEKTIILCYNVSIEQPPSLSTQQ